MKAVLSAVAQVAIAALLFALAWRTGFWQADVFLAILAVASVAMLVYLRAKDPALLKRRTRGPQHEKETSQKALHWIVVLSLAGALGLAACDHYYGWSTVPIALQIAGDAVVALALLTYFVVFRENTFAGATIDVADDQKVIATGPYALVRHPMYVGLVSMFAGAPLALGSWWALGFCLPMILALRLRIIYEERVLERSLPGYEQYERRVRYRLVPRLW